MIKYNGRKVEIDDNSSGIVVSSNFLGLPPLPYSISSLQNSLLTTTNKPQTSLNHTTEYYQMAASNYHRPSFGLTKPSSFNQHREKERFELSALNDKFADYLEKVRYLEAQNKKIQMDTTVLTDKQQENCQKMKTIFETELEQLKQVAKQLFENKNTIFNTSQNAQTSISSLKQNLDQTYKQSDTSKYETEKLERHLSTVEGDIIMFKRRLVHQDNEHTQWKQFISQIQRLLLQAKNEIHNENFKRTSSEQAAKQLRTDINHLREQQQIKLKELKQSSLILNSNSVNDRALMFKSELSNAIRKIRQDFEKQNDSHRNQLYLQFTQSYENISRQYPELEHGFSNEHERQRIKQEEERVRSELQRIHTDNNLLKQKSSDLKLRIRELELNLQVSIEENKRIEQVQKNQINQMRLKHEKTNDDYEKVITKQTTLEKEISTYRNLLEGKMKPVIDHITEGYSTVPRNQDLTDRTTIRLERVDQIPSKSHDTNSYVSYMSWDNKNQATKSQQNVEDLNFKANDTVETTDTLSPRNNRVPIVIQTRRNK